MAIGFYGITDANSFVVINGTRYNATGGTIASANPGDDIQLAVYVTPNSDAFIPAFYSDTAGGMISMGTETATTAGFGYTYQIPDISMSSSGNLTGRFICVDPWTYATKWAGATITISEASNVVIGGDNTSPVVHTCIGSDLVTEHNPGDTECAGGDTYTCTDSVYGAGWALSYSGCGTNPVGSVGACTIGTEVVANNGTFCDGNNNLFVCNNGNFVYKSANCNPDLASGNVTYTQCFQNGIAINKGESACIGGLVYGCGQSLDVEPTSEQCKDNGDGTYTLITTGGTAVSCNFTIQTKSGGGNATVGETVSFMITGCSGTPVSYSWDFGDGATSTGNGTKTHVYASAGTFYPQLMVTNPSGDSSSVKGTVTVTSAGTVTPVIRTSGTGGTIVVNSSGHQVVVTSGTVLTTGSGTHIVVTTSGHAITSSGTVINIGETTTTTCSGLYRNGAIDPTCALQTGNEMYLYGAAAAVILVILLARR